MPKPLLLPRAATAQRGFTLIELMIAVAVIGILAAVAMPAYTDHVKRGKLTEAFSQLSAQSLGMEQWYQDNRNYATAALCNNNPVSSKYFTITCSGATATDYTLTATAKTGSGVDGATYTINRAGLRATLGMPAGWTVPTAPNCWGADRGGNCY